MSLRKARISSNTAVLTWNFSVEGRSACGRGTPCPRLTRWKKQRTPPRISSASATLRSIGTRRCAEQPGKTPPCPRTSGEGPCSLASPRRGPSRWPRFNCSSGPRAESNQSPDGKNLLLAELQEWWATASANAMMGFLGQWAEDLGAEHREAVRILLRCVQTIPDSKSSNVHQVSHRRKDRTGLRTKLARGQVFFLAALDFITA